MLDFRIIHAGVYRHAQNTNWTNPWPLVGLYVRGLLWREDATGRHTTFTPGLILRPAGENVKYAYGPNRENWVISLETHDIRASKNPAMALLKSGRALVPVPRFTPLASPRLEEYQNLFRQIEEDSRDPSAIGQFRARAKVITVLGRMLDQGAGVKALSPAERFKQMLDADEQWGHSLEEMSHDCGFSVDHLRVLFEREFGINPHTYRQQRRLLRATQLLEHTPLRIKEIAARLGFRHVSHFCMAYRYAFGVSPAATRNPMPAPSVVD